ncbi:MAG: GHKL domain-containing protein [Candidatus Aminicenantes bacterium]|nr:GHKL domain-containing protein [Candidatus Aminicenantes bacterium]
MIHSRRFRFQVAWRLLLAALATGCFFAFWRRPGFAIAMLLAAAVFVSALVSLFRYIDRSNRGLVRFLQAVRYHDFSLSPGIEGLGGSFTELNAAFREISGQFQRAREEKEEQYRYLQTVVQHIAVGLLSVRADGCVDLLNNAAKRLLRLPHLRRISDLPPQFAPLRAEIEHLRPGEKSLLRLDFSDEELQLSLAAIEFKLRGQLFKLVSLQNIQVELEEKEAEAWQSLTRVLTHEIMNSLTPIASLAATASSLLPGPAAAGDATDPCGREIDEALRTIHRRSEGLMRFVHAYRSVALIPQPQFRIFPVAEMFRRIEKLLNEKLSRQGIRFQVEVEPPSLELTADPDLTEQVLINLLLNAIEALGASREPRIRLHSHMNERGRVVIQVEDNGPGISPEAREKIFIPFFTTKEEGSGIGLSFSRQVMRLHRGVITVHSQPEAGTVFSLRF